jgi:hypothetical protein
MKNRCFLREVMCRDQECNVTWISTPSRDSHASSHLGQRGHLGHLGATWATWGLTGLTGLTDLTDSSLLSS